MLHHDTKMFPPLWPPSPNHWAAAGSTGGGGWPDGVGLGKDPLGVHLEWGGAWGGRRGQRGPRPLPEHAGSEEIYHVIGSPLWDSPCPPAQTGIYSEAARGGARGGIQRAGDGSLGHQDRRPGNLYDPFRLLIKGEAPYLSLFSPHV